MSNTPTDAELKKLAEECGIGWAAGLGGMDDFLSAFARAVLAKWGTPPVMAGEPVAWLSTDCIGERYLCFTKPNDSDPARPLVFGDSAPQPTQAQAGAVPQCWCLTCKPMRIDEPSSIRMALCPTCGNKRCPKANDHRNRCSNSNVPGQKGSAYEGCGITQKGGSDAE